MAKNDASERNPDGTLRITPGATGVGAIKNNLYSQINDKINFIRGGLNRSEGNVGGVQTSVPNIPGGMVRGLGAPPTTAEPAMRKATDRAYRDGGGRAAQVSQVRPTGATAFYNGVPAGTPGLSTGYSGKNRLQ